MWKKVLISGAVGAVILGAGGTALAATGGSSPAPNPTATSSAQSAHPKAKARIGATLRRTVHATWTTGKDGHFVTHDTIRGTATVSTSSITVTAADGTTQTYAVTPTTKVRDKGDLRTTVPFSTVHSGDAVGVLGTGSGGNLTATRIVDVPKS